MDEFLLFFISIMVLFCIFHKVNHAKHILKLQSSVDNRIYIVRKELNAQEAADKLARINQKIINLLTYFRQGNYMTSDIKRLSDKYNPNQLSETLPGSKYTSYSVNKGEQISLCIRHSDNTFIDDNTVIFVLLHELAHIMTTSVGHTKEFWDNMKYLLEQGEILGIYKPVDYSENPVNYCGMIINSSPYDFKK
jgi:predicted metal-dependent hydrolase